MKKLLTTKNLVLMAMFSAFAAVIMAFLEFPIPFIAPGFYKLDLSEIPIMIGTFIMGPVAGVIMEVVKILLKLILKPSETGYVGELANLLIGCAYILPAGIIYKLKRSKSYAILGMIAGTLTIAVIGAIINYYIMIPFYGKFMPIDKIIKSGAAINPLISNKWTFVWIAVAPFNLLKGIIVGTITAIIYKRISIIIKKIGD